MLPSSIEAAAGGINGESNGGRRIDGTRKSFSKARGTLPRGRLRLPLRVLWLHRTKGEHEQKCCPAVEHDFLQANETGPSLELLNGLTGELLLAPENKGLMPSRVKRAAPLHYAVPSIVTHRAKHDHSSAAMYILPDHSTLETESGTSSIGPELP